MHDEFIMPALSEMARALGEEKLGKFVDEDTAWAANAYNKFATEKVCVGDARRTLNS
jgi:hypothetical protein